MDGDILVPLDGSPLAERALPYAADLAAATGARLRPFRAVPAIGPGAGPDGAQAADDYLAALARGLAAQGLTASTELAAGEPARCIVERARRPGVALIALATHGAAGLGRTVYGRVAGSILERAPVPVLVARAWLPVRQPALRTDHPRVLVPLDGSAFAEAALPVAADLARTLGGSLVLVRAVAPADPVAALVRRGGRAGGGPEDGAPARRAAEADLADAAARHAAGIPVAGEATVGWPGEVIAAAGRRHDAALVVLATHGHAEGAHLLPGSVADAVLRGDDRPLVLVHPPAR